MSKYISIQKKKPDGYFITIFYSVTSVNAMGEKAMVRVTFGGNAHSLHIKAAANPNVPLHAIIHHGGRHYCRKMVSTIVIC